MLPGRREQNARRKYKNETDSLEKMGKALGWRRETVPDEPLRYTSEEGFSGGPGGTHAIKEINVPHLGTSAVVDAVENVGKPKVTVKSAKKGK